MQSWFKAMHIVQSIVVIEYVQLSYIKPYFVFCTYV